MIELRWLVKRGPRPRGFDEGFYSPPLPDTTETHTLQYRERVNENTATEWQDVQTVELRDE